MKLNFSFLLGPETVGGVCVVGGATVSDSHSFLATLSPQTSGEPEDEDVSCADARPLLTVYLRFHCMHDYRLKVASVREDTGKTGLASENL